jgi:hypothetical protein
VEVTAIENGPKNRMEYVLQIVETKCIPGETPVDGINLECNVRIGRQQHGCGGDGDIC